jgi:hypothetical protein
MTDNISEQYETELQLIEIERKKKDLPKLDPKSYSELSKLCDEVLEMIEQRRKRWDHKS